MLEGGGRVYDPAVAQSGLDQRKFGFDSGAVSAADIAKIHLVNNRTIIDSLTQAEYLARQTTEPQAAA